MLRVPCSMALAAAALALGACAQNPKDSKGGIDEKRAIEVAKEAVRKNDTWVDKATFEAKRDGSGWSVMVWREPKVPGGHRLVLIDGTGKVTAYHRGE